jgi:hypothetical protein
MEGEVVIEGGDPVGGSFPSLVCKLNLHPQLLCVEVTLPDVIVSQRNFHWVTGLHGS